MSQKRGYVRLAEAALGHELPKGALVHHVDQDRTHNWNGNLVILQSQGDHNELHRKMRVRARGGDPWTQQTCCTCHKVKDFDQFPPSRQTNGSRCLTCSASINAARRGGYKTTSERSVQGRLAALKRWQLEVLYATH